MPAARWPLTLCTGGYERGRSAQIGGRRPDGRSHGHQQERYMTHLVEHTHRAAVPGHRRTVGPRGPCSLIPRATHVLSRRRIVRSEHPELAIRSYSLPSTNAATTCSNTTRSGAAADGSPAGERGQTPGALRARSSTTLVTWDNSASGPSSSPLALRLAQQFIGQPNAPRHPAGRRVIRRRWIRDSR